MTREDRELLLKDLCTRLPYETRVYIEVLDDNRSMLYGGSGDDELDTMWIGVLQSGNPYHIIKPYLRRMSSMTDEERNELKLATCPNGTGYFDERYLVCPVNHFGEKISYDFMSDIISWLNSHHFDYHGLIEKGLALEAPEGMYNE